MQEAFVVRSLPAAEIALSLGNPKCMNLVMFGALTVALDLRNIDWEEIIRKTVPPAYLDLNLRAYRAGVAAVQQ
jgi:indolepyruvate ferredoxin oxidoreductase beta subunit